MRGSEAYPINLVENFTDAVRQHNRRPDAVRPPASTDMMILRALLAHPLVDRTQEIENVNSASLTTVRPH